MTDRRHFVGDGVLGYHLEKRKFRENFPYFRAASVFPFSPGSLVADGDDSRWEQGSYSSSLSFFDRAIIFSAMGAGTSS